VESRAVHGGRHARVTIDERGLALKIDVGELRKRFPLGIRNPLVLPRRRRKVGVLVQGVVVGRQIGSGDAVVVIRIHAVRDLEILDVVGERSHLESIAAADCLREIVENIRKKKINTGFPIEFRSVAADDVWLSPFYKRESATIAVHQYYKVDTTKLFNEGETIFRKYEGRPHWGKRHTRTAHEFAAIYPEFERFRELRRKLDPGAKFLNAHLRTIFD